MSQATEEHSHPSERSYVKIAIVLALVTAAEVAIYYVESLADFLVPFLIAFAVIKFFLVATWFMHLRFDNRAFRRLFVLGIILAIGVFTIVLMTFFWRGSTGPGVTG